MSDSFMKYVITGLTISRMLLAPFVFFSFASGTYATGMSLFLLARVTDILDGFLARRYKNETETGAFLDQIADRIGMVSLTGGFFVGSDFPFYAFLIFAGRDLFLIILNSAIFFQENPIPKPTVLSMSATFLQFASIMSYYFLFFERTFLVTAILFTAASSIECIFLMRNRKK